MSSLAAQRCLNHEAREAVSRCPQCRNYFCRECVVSFQERMLCAECLSQNVAAVPQSRSRFGLAGLLFAAMGFVLVWLLFYFVGWAILQLRDRASETDSSRNPAMIQV